jgi:hypothetical protein
MWIIIYCYCSKWIIMQRKAGNEKELTWCGEMKSKTMVMACSRHRFCFSSLSVCVFLGFSVLYSFLVFSFVRSWFSGLSLCLSASGSLSLSYFAFVLGSCVVPVFIFISVFLSVFFSLSFSLWGLSLSFIKPGRSCVHASRNEARSVRDLLA